MKIILNDDKEVVITIREGLKRTGGYCPCKIEHSQENKCLCKEFLEQKTEGLCHCGLYRKVEV